MSFPSLLGTWLGKESYVSTVNQQRRSLCLKLLRRTGEFFSFHAVVLGIFSIEVGHFLHLSIICVFYCSITISSCCPLPVLSSPSIMILITQCGTQSLSAADVQIISSDSLSSHPSPEATLFYRVVHLGCVWQVQLGIRI